MPVRFQIVNHHPTAALDCDTFERVGAATTAIHPPGDLQLVEVSFVTDEVIAGVHGQFLEDATPTDVISFQHGELIISVDTAIRRHSAEGLSLEQELSLYLIHGLLHLAGYNDKNPEESKAMKEEQERILAQFWEESSP